MTSETTAVTKREKHPDPLVRQFQDMRSRGYNTLMPSATVLQNIPPHMQVSIDIITINTDPALKEVYNTGSDKNPQLGLGKTAIMKIASAAGLQVDPILTKRLDDRKDRRYCAYQAVVWLTKPDGTRLCFKAEKEYDLDVIEEKILEQKKARATGRYAKDWEKVPGWAEEQTRKELLQIREHLASLCETKAILRAIRGVMAIKTSYTPAELAQPFAVARVSYRLDYKDPMVRARVLDNALGSTAQLYGQAAAGELAANVEQVEYLSAGRGLEEDDLADFGILPEQETRQAIAAPTEQDDDREVVDGEPGGSVDGAIETSATVVEPTGAPAGDNPPKDPQAAAKGAKASKAKAQEPAAAPAAGACEVCALPLSEKELADAAQGFPPVHSACLDAQLAGEGGAA